MAIEYHLPPVRFVWFASAFGYGGSIAVAILVCVVAIRRGAQSLDEREY
jgi:hypothetical protein